MMFESSYIYLIIEYLGYSNLAIIAIGLYAIYYLLSNTFMFILFLIIGIIIGIYIGGASGAVSANSYMKLMY